MDEREHGDLHRQTRGLVAPIGPDVGEADLVLERPLRGVGIGQRPHADLESAAGITVPVHVDEAQLSGAKPHDAVPVEHSRSLPVAERLARRERDERQDRRVGEGVAGDEAEGEVGPPEPPVVRDHGVGDPQPVWDRPRDHLLHPLADVGAEAVEVGVVAADDWPELGDHVAAAAAGVEEEAQEGPLRDELGLGDGERGGGGGVEDDVAADELVPGELAQAGAVDDQGPRGADLVGVEEEEAGGVGGEDGGEAAVGGGVWEEARRDGEERDARGRRRAPARGRGRRPAGGRCPRRTRARRCPE